MRKWIICLVVLLLGTAACQKPYETQIELGVNHEQILLPSSEAGHCYITVFSNGSWTIKTVPAAAWARLEKASGDGIGYVRLDYDENLSGEERSATVVVEGQGKKCEILVTQPK